MGGRRARLLFPISPTSIVTTISKPSLDQNMPAQFTGSENFYRHALVREMIFTGGVKYVADIVGAQ